MDFEYSINQLKQIVDEDIIIEMAYTPVYLQIMAFNMVDKAAKIFADNKVSETKKEMRDLKNIGIDQMHRYKYAIPFDTFNMLKECAVQFEEAIYNDTILYYFSYDQIFKNQFKGAEELSSAIAYLAIAYDIMYELNKFDQYVEDKINRKYFSKSPIKYKREKLWLESAYSSTIFQIIKKLGYDLNVDSENIRNARKILDKNTKAIKYN